MFAVVSGGYLIVFGFGNSPPTTTQVMERAGDGKEKKNRAGNGGGVGGEGGGWGGWGAKVSGRYWFWCC